MRKFIKIMLALIVGAGISVPTFAQDSPKKKVAVYMTGSKVDESYKKVIGAKLVSAITESGEYAAVERTADFLAAIADETSYQLSGEVRDSQIARLGQKFGVRYVIVADISEVFDELFIAARMINVENGLVEKSSDVNGSAESMAQLIALSKSVAAGLLKGDVVFLSEQPIHLALCATYKNGKTYYITTEQWKDLSDSKKQDLTKKGVCIRDGNSYFVVALHDSGIGDWYYACNNHAPNRRQFEVMYQFKTDLNNALLRFGGSKMEDDWYWTCKSYDSSSAWNLYFLSGGMYYPGKGNTYRVRPVAPVAEPAR